MPTIFRGHVSALELRRQRKRSSCLVWLAAGVLASLPALVPSSSAADASTIADDSTAGGRGNAVCWDAPNWLGVELSYQRCCESGPDEEDACFQALGGWYSYEYCCFPEPPTCDWEAIGDRVAASPSVGEQAGMLQIFPVVLREFCCLFPGATGGNGADAHPCWGDDGGYGDSQAFDPAEGLTLGFVQCCFPVLRRHLSQSDTPEWLQRELDREFAPLVGRRFSAAALDAFETALRDDAGASAGAGNRPCRLRVRNGREVSLCDFDVFCPKDVDSGDPLSANNDCSYVRAVRLALRILGTIRPLPDMDLFISPFNHDRAETSVPVFTRHRPKQPRSNYVLLPSEWQLHPWQMRKLTIGVEREAARHDWEQRRPQLLWRGSNSNCEPSCKIAAATRGEASWHSCVVEAHCNATWNWSNWLNMPRGRLVSLTSFFPDIDARWTGTSQPMEPSLWQFFESSGLTAQRLEPREQLQWRFALNIDGTGNGDRVHWHMLAGQVVLVCDSPLISWGVGEVGSTQHAALRAFEHYVPVKFDLSDLPERLAWLRGHDDEARRIATAGRRFAIRNLHYDGVLRYVDAIVRRYADEHLVPGDFAT